MDFPTIEGPDGVILGTDFLKAQQLSVDPTAAKFVAGTSSNETAASAIWLELSIVPATVPVLHGQAANDSSAVPASNKQAVSTSSVLDLSHNPPDLQLW